VSGKGALNNVSIDDSLMNADEKDMLEDLLVAAFTDAKKKADETAQTEMGDLAGGMGLPADFKLPF
jgi:DNA-binding protein YbaB